MTNTGLKCPTCESPSPRLHPATQAEGEVIAICPDDFHLDGELWHLPVEAQTDEVTR